ncbi:MAG: hypothetical protein JSV12_03515 [Candidatus Bathyarchaeota archaeon]|nr:MAG: hypothetical protein JSV12_03515 [Candidatus Bathyarchaeota archaeon]
MRKLWTRAVIIAEVIAIMAIMVGVYQVSAVKILKSTYGTVGWPDVDVWLNYGATHYAIGDTEGAQCSAYFYVDEPLVLKATAVIRIQKPIYWWIFLIGWETVAQDYEEIWGGSGEEFMRVSAQIKKGRIEIGVTKIYLLGTYDDWEHWSF